MDIPQRPGDLVEYLYELSVKPERLFELIGEWDAGIESSDPGSGVRLREGTGFARHVERALGILDELNAFEFGRLDDLLAGLPSAAMVLNDRGAVVAANEPARAAFGLFPGGSIRQMPIAAPDLAGFADRLAAVALANEPRDDVLQLHLAGRARPILMHLRTLATGREQRHALAVGSEHLWQDAAGGVLERVFGLTAAEIALVRQLTAGETVQEVARAGGRSEGTIRVQLHSVLGKTGTHTQGELVRLATMLLQAVSFDAARTRPTRGDGVRAREPRSGHLRLADGRRLAVLQYGDPTGRPVLWLQSQLGFFQPTASGERELLRRRLRIIVPVRAGYGTSDPAPPGRDVLEVAVADLEELLRQACIDRCPVVTTYTDIRVALMLARQAPERVERIVSVATVLPILKIEQFRRLDANSRFYKVMVRYAPRLLPFIVRAWHANIRRSGLHAALRHIYRESPADSRAFADPGIADAVMSAYGLMFAPGTSAQTAFCAEALRFQDRWPAGLGGVACPVTLIHGEQDRIGPWETALDYCAANPAWRHVSFPDEAQLVGFTRWSDVLDEIAGPGSPPPPAAIPAPAP
ncbi:MAG: hypothetical protein U1E59_06700 [Amaricoccus sp.]